MAEKSDELEAQAMVPAPPVQPRAARKAKLLFKGEKNHGTAVGKLVYREGIVLERGKVVEVNASEVAGILRAFKGRYEIEEVG